MSYAEQLARDLGKDWADEVVEDDRQRSVLELLTGKKARLELPDGGVVEIKYGELRLSGTTEQVEEIEWAASALRARLLEKARELTAQRQQLEAQLAARQKAEMNRRTMAASLVAVGKGSTISGSRGAGAMPLEISFPSFGTRPYAFHLDYAGSSQARIKVRCVRQGPALVLQGFIVLAVPILLGLLARRRVWLGASMYAAFGILLVLMWISADGAVRQYLGMAFGGLVLAAPFLLWLTIRAVRRMKPVAERNLT